MNKNAPLVYFHKTGNNEVSVYEASSAFYLNHIDAIAKGDMPDNVPRLYTKQYTHQEITLDSLQKKIEEQHSATNKKLSMDCILFKDSQQQEDFEKNGYVVIDLIDKNIVDLLTSFYKNVEKNPLSSYGFHVSLDNEDTDQIRTISEYLIQTVRPDLDKYFQNHRIFTASFVIKDKNPMGIVPPHQDWTFVNENEYWSATIWCPLVDVNFENGALGVIRGSHLFYDHVRPSPSSSYEPPFKNEIETIFPYLDILDLKAGQAIVFNNKTIHGSPPNTVDQSRLAFGIGITHQEASIFHYYMLPDKEKKFIETFEVDPSFFFKYNNARLSDLYAHGKKPHDLNSVGVFRYTYIDYKKNELIEKMESAGNKKNDLFRGSEIFRTEKISAVVQGQPEVFHQPKLPFWKVYTPMNIFKEIRYRILKR